MKPEIFEGIAQVWKKLHKKSVSLSSNVCFNLMFTVKNAMTAVLKLHTHMHLHGDQYDGEDPHKRVKNPFISVDMLRFSLRSLSFLVFKYFLQAVEDIIYSITHCIHMVSLSHLTFVCDGPVRSGLTAISNDPRS